MGDHPHPEAHGGTHGGVHGAGPAEPSYGNGPVARWTLVTPWSQPVVRRRSNVSPSTSASVWLHGGVEGEDEPVGAADDGVGVGEHREGQLRLLGHADRVVWGLR